MSTTDDKKAQLTDKKEQQPADQKKKDKKEEDLSEDDIRLKEQIELLVTRIQDVDSGVQKLALDTLKNEIRTATSSMTSVPKPLKFLRPHFETLKTHFATMADSDNKRYLADIISVVGMTSDSAAARDTLNFKLQGTKENVSVWGHEYLRHLASEISEEYADRVDNQKPVDDILVLVDQIVPHNVEHNAEAEACDLLMEVERVQNLIALATESNYQKICQYLIACSSYVPEEEDVEVLRVTMEIYKKLNKPTEAVRIAIRLGRKDIIKEILGSADPLVQKQIAYMLARHNLYEVVADNDDYDLKEIAGNNKLSEHFLALVKELDVLEPKKPEEDIFKSHLSDIKVPLNTKGDSARNNLAVTFVNAFVNAGFGTDKLMLTNEEGNNWVFKNKDHGMLSAAASVGMLYLWDISTGLNQIDKYTLSNDDNIKAGAVLAGGLLCAGYRNDDIDPAVGFLPNYLEDKSNLVMTCACLGLGVAYAGSSREDIKGLLMTAFDNQTNNMESLGLIALALGLVFVGTGDAEISESFLSAFLEQTETALKSTYARYLCLGLGLLYLGKQEVAELTIEALKAISAPIGRYAMLTVETCAYMGSGNVLKIQKLLADCGEHPAVTPEEEAQKEKERDAGKEKDKEKEEKEKEEQNKKMAHQGVAVLGIAGIAMCEDVGSQMSMRSFDHLLQYGEPSVRRAVPLAIALINVSNADLGIMDTLSKLSHDHDPEVAMGAIFALGIVGAGTNNARIAQLLRQLASYYYKDPNMLFLVRIAQGYLHMGKGTIGVKPYHSERLLLNPVATAGLLAVLHSGLDMKNIILGKSHYMMYLLSLAMYPRALIAVNEEGEPINVSVRVGQAVDVIGQAGKPKTITGFQTHNTPVLLSHGERAELATDMYIPVASILEGVVIMKVNPDSKDAKKKKKEEAKAAAAAEKNGSK